MLQILMSCKNFIHDILNENFKIFTYLTNLLDSVPLHTNNWSRKLKVHVVKK